MARSDTGTGAQAINLASDTSLSSCNGLYVGGAGNVKVDMRFNGTGITFSGVVAGTVLPIQVTKVYSTANGTTATNIVALY